MTAPGDQRLRLIRDGAAARSLEGLAAAERYLDPVVTTARRGLALRTDPDGRAQQVDALLVGELFAVLATERGWAFGQAARDGYVGWVERDGLAERAGPPTHRVASLSAIAYAAPSPRAGRHTRLDLNALVWAGERRDGFVEAVGVGWVVETALAPIGSVEAEPAAVAARFVGVPYLWGGRGADGIDCSGLVQAALFACGRACPRDSDLQAGLGRAADRQDLGRNDLVLWPGHIGVMADAEHLIHASGRWMSVVAEPLVEVIAARGETGEPSGYRRIVARGAG